MMIYQSTSEDEGDEMLRRVSATAEESIDNMLRYLYYFVSGQHEFMHERYRSAIKLFRKAERLLENVNDEAEEAEFHYFMGAALQRIDHNAYAASYLEDAMLSFQRLQYTERVLYCSNLLAGIFSEARMFEKAEEMLVESIHTAKFYPYTKLILLRTLGINAYRKKDFLVAKGHYEEVLKDEKYSGQLIHITTHYNLARTLFHLRDDKKAVTHLEVAKNGSLLLNLKEYSMRCQILENIYVNRNYNQLLEELNQLEEMHFYYEVNELSEELSAYFQEKESFKQAFSFLQKAYNAKQKVSTLGVDQI
ncbi:response regulator aspartate phosphatase [Bacillus sp. JCM 19046]|nr:response regulator aspartate phosphatase [Bacillus sp. JCM 19045]GAF19711.1 response regulator aspartate phosphatase [Bacillus sp. JCM 19046]